MHTPVLRKSPLSALYASVCVILQMQVALADPAADHRKAFEEQAASASESARQNAAVVKTQPTRKDGDLWAAEADRAAQIAEAWLQQVDADIAAKRDWRSDQAMAKKAIMAAANAAQNVAAAARANGAFWGGRVKIANDAASENNLGAATLALKAVAGESHLPEALSAAAEYTRQGQLAMAGGMPVAAQEDFAAANVARIAATMFKVNETTSVSAKLIPAQAASTAVDAQLMKTNGNSSEAASGKITPKRAHSATTTAKSALPNADLGVAGHVIPSGEEGLQAVPKRW